MMRLVGPAACIVILLAAVLFAPGPSGSLWVSRLHDFAHAPIFGCVAVFLVLVARHAPVTRTWSVRAQYAVAFISTVFLGVLTEVVQMYTGRDASWMDAANDLLGAVAFLAAFAAFDGSHRSSAVRVALIAGGVGLIVAVAAPVLRAAYEYYRRDAQFPVLADFAERYDRYFMHATRSRLEYGVMPDSLARTPQEPALHVRFSQQMYPGVDMHEPVADWSRYRELRIDAANPTAEPLNLVVRVHDAHHNNEFADRFNQPFTLGARSREVLRIPLADIARGPQSRELDMTQIAGVVVFRADQTSAREMYIVKVWLE